MKRLISVLLAVALLFALLCGCNHKPAQQGEGLNITFNNEEGAIPQQTEPVEPLNKAMEREDLSFKGDHYGVVMNDVAVEDVKASNIDTFDGGGNDIIAVMPYYNGSKVLVESVKYDMEKMEIVPTGTLFESVATDDYALIVKVNRPEGVFPEMRITVEYDGVIYSHLIKNIPDAQIEYIR